VDHIDGDYGSGGFSGRARSKYTDQDGQLTLFGPVAGTPSDAA
jgi:hypothetical protein